MIADSPPTRPRKNVITNVKRHAKCSLFLELCEISQKQRVIRVSLAFIYPFISLPTQPVHPATFFVHAEDRITSGGQVRRIIHVFRHLGVRHLNPNWLSMLSSMHFNRILVMSPCESRGWPYTRRCGAGCRFRRRWCSCSGVSSTLIVFRDGYTWTRIGSVSVSVSASVFRENWMLHGVGGVVEHPLLEHVHRAYRELRQEPPSTRRPPSVWRTRSSAGRSRSRPDTLIRSASPRSTYTGRCTRVCRYFLFVARQIRRVGQHELPRVVWRVGACPASPRPYFGSMS
jgi:hypothetical protein